MRKFPFLIVLLFTATLFLSSCYSYTSVVGDGAQGQKQNTEWNHYILWGLAPINVSDSAEMADGAENYTIHTRQSFVNGLCHVLTFGIYSPTTTTVTK